MDEELKDATKQLQVATDLSTRPGAAAELVIVSAWYGPPSKKHVIDITKNIRKALASGVPSIKLNTADGAAGVDPAPATPKETIITYIVNGQRKQKTFPEGQRLTFKDDLQ